MNVSRVRLLRSVSYVCAPVCLLGLFWVVTARAQQALTAAADWQQVARQQAADRKLDAALQTIETRLIIHPDDLEAHGWRGRVLAWKGRWAEAENEYRFVLERAPDDVDILIALADVLLWQGKPQPALETVDRARARSPSEKEVLLCRARILQALGRTSDLREQLRELLRVDAVNKEAKSWLSSLRSESKHELRVGNDVDIFNYTDPAQTQAAVLTSHWNRRWSTVLSSQIYERFAQEAQKFSANAILHISAQDWLELGGAGANDNGIVPRSETAFEYGHAFRFRNHFIAGLEASYQQRWLWYRGAHILTLTAAQTYYLPRDFSWTLIVAGARSGFTHTGVEWLSSGSTRIRFPLYQRLSGNLSFGVGSESYAEVDEIGRFCARTFAGGLQFRFAPNQDISGYVARQNRSQDRSQTSYGLSYGIHF